MVRDINDYLVRRLGKQYPKRFKEKVYELITVAARIQDQCIKGLTGWITLAHVKKNDAWWKDTDKSFPFSGM